MATDEQDRRDLDAPSPPGSPMRRDAPDADVNPGPQGTQPRDPEPNVEPSSTPDGPSVVPSPSTPPGEPGPDPSSDPEPETRPAPNGPATQTQVENAETSLDQPSDASGGE